MELYLHFTIRLHGAVLKHRDNFYLLYKYHFIVRYLVSKLIHLVSDVVR